MQHQTVGRRAAPHSCCAPLGSRSPRQLNTSAFYLPNTFSTNNVQSWSPIGQDLDKVDRDGEDMRLEDCLDAVGLDYLLARRVLI